MEKNNDIKEDLWNDFLVDEEKFESSEIPMFLQSLIDFKIKVYKSGKVKIDHKHISNNVKESLKLFFIARFIASYKENQISSKVKLSELYVNFPYTNQKTIRGRIAELCKDGILKISPFYYWSDEDLDNYVEVHNLPKNDSYFDVTKASANRECGIHLQ